MILNGNDSVDDSFVTVEQEIFDFMSKRDTFESVAV